MYVTTCSITFQLRPQAVPDSEQSSEKRGLNCEELRDRYTGPPRGTSNELGYPCPEGHEDILGDKNEFQKHPFLEKCRTWNGNDFTTHIDFGKYNKLLFL
jgi:hypothetical protein